jgi:cell division protein FtsB
MASTRKKISHAKEAFYIICILVALLVGLFSFVGPGGYLEMKQAQTELQIRSDRVEELQKENAECLRTIDELRNDPEALERYMRQKGYAKRGEIIQEIPQSEPPVKPPIPGPRPAARKSG